MQTVPEQMRALVLLAPRQLEIQQRPVPQPAPGEVLIKVLSASTSGSDANLYRSGRNQHTELKGPLVLGRTASGEVVAVGEGVPEERIGQLVSIEPLLPCGRCSLCRKGRYNLCETGQRLGSPGADGVFREYVAWDARFAHQVKTLTPDAAALIEPMAVGLAALNKAHVGAGSRVLVAGAGPIGLVTVAVAKALGATEIFVTDLNPERLDHALRLGATTACNMSEMGIVIPERHFEAFIECSGSAAAVRRGFPALRPGGRVALVGRGADEIAFPVTLMQNRELTICGSFRYANLFGTAIAMAENGVVDLNDLVTAHFSLDQVAEALEQGKDPSQIKAIIHPGR